MYALCVNATLKQIELCEVSVVVFAVLVDQDVYSSLKCHICNENVNFEWLSIALYCKYLKVMQTFAVVLEVIQFNLCVYH